MKMSKYATGRSWKSGCLQVHVYTDDKGMG